MKTSPFSQKGNVVKVMQPVEFSMDYKVVDSPTINRETKFCKMCPVTDSLKPSAIHIKIPFANGCGGKSICLADLKLEAQSSNKGQSIVLGKDTKFTVAVSVFNTKEPAYLVRMSLTLPKSTSLLKMPKHCYQEEDGAIDNPEEDMILCGLGNILETDRKTKITKERTTEFDIDLSNVGYDTSLLTLNITTWSASEERTPGDNTVLIRIPVKLSSEVEIAGNTMQKLLLLSSKDESLPSVISVIHKYQITNFGPSPVGQIDIRSSLPYGLMIDDELGVFTFGEIINPQVTIKGHTVQCSVDYSSLNIASNHESRHKRDTLSLEAGETETYLAKNIFHLNCSESSPRKVVCALVTCAVGVISSGDTAELEVQFNINKTMIDLIQQKDIIQLSSTAWIKIPEKYEIPSRKRMKLTNVATVLAGNFEETVSPWILALAAMLGLVLLLVVVRILSGAGFFRRKYKEDMETMKDAARDFAYEKFLPEFETNIFF